MREQRGHLSAEELRELNEFTVEDERVPSPEQIESNDTIVLPEIQTMTGYIRQHYEANIVEEAARKLRNGDLCVRHENRIYRTCPWLGPADYDGEEVEAILEVASTPGDYAQFADIIPLGGEITWMNFWRTGGNFVDAELVLTMHIELDIDGVKTDVSERYAVDMWFDMEDDIVGEMGNIQLYYRSAERSGVKLDEYLVPILSIDDIEAEAERILLNINPKGLQDPQLLCSGVLAERLDLQIIHLNLYQKKHTSSILFFGPGELKIKAGFSDDEEPQVMQIAANTIVVNDETKPFGSDPVYHAKEYLSQVMYIDRRIDSKLEQVMSLREAATKATATLSDMPRPDSPNIRSMEDTIVKIIDLENEINRDIDRLIDLKAEACRLISQVKEPDQQLVLELRYLCYKPWNEIMVELGCSEPTVYRLHGEALKKIVLPKNLIASDMQ